MKRILNVGIFALVALAMAFGAVALPSRAADHLDAPLVQQDGRIDINDVYVFHPGSGSSQDLSRTVLAMTVNPAAGVISGTDFRANSNYDFLIDKDGDAEWDLRVRTRFLDPLPDGSQQLSTDVTLRFARRNVVATGMTEQVIQGKQGVKVFAGVRDDPFYFDLANFNNGATFCGAGLPVSDFFLGLDVSALVIDLPTSLIGSGPVGVWAATDVPGMGQVDRMGRPGINTVFIPTNPFEPNEASQKDSFNTAMPKTDQQRFRGEIVDTLTLLYSLNDSAGDDPSDDAATIQAIADVLLPDILTVDLSQATGFLNGRNLADDVIDAELGLITEGLLTTDCVDNDSSFLSGFPYLGAPNN